MWDRYGVLKMILNEKTLTLKLNLFRKDASKLSALLVRIYCILVLAAFTLIMLFDIVWYLKLVYIVFALILPVLVGNYVINFMTYRVIKKIPDSLEEFQYNLNKSFKIDTAIKATSENLKGYIKRPFQILYYNLSRNSSAAFDDFKRTFDDKNINAFSELLKAYIVYGGDLKELNNQISNLIVKIREENMFSEKAREKFLKYKLGAIFMVVVTLLMQKYMNVIVPEIGQEQSPLDSMKYVLVVMFYIIYFFSMDFLRKL
jgi:Flp pilus assembly protein TadB